MSLVTLVSSLLLVLVRGMVRLMRLEVLVRLMGGWCMVPVVGMLVPRLLPYVRIGLDHGVEPS